MRKKIISLLICLVLFFSMCIAAGATDIDKIQSDGVVINPSSNQTSNIYMYTTPDGTTVIIPSYTIPVVQTPTEETKDNKTEEVKEQESNTIETETTDVEVDVENLTKDIFELVNKERETAGVDKLTYSKDLQDAANTRAKECTTLFSHTRPDGSHCDTVIEDMDYTVTGENLIMADNPLATAENLMDTWMNSEGHCKNILLPEFTEMAIGIYVTDGVTYAAQIFMG